MTSSEAPAPAVISTDGRVACATMLWRFRERLELTVVVKALFSFAPSGVAAFVGPGVIHREDQPFAGNPARSVQFASDLVPYRARCDVTFVGHAYSPQARAESVVPIRLGIFRNNHPLLDKSLRVLGARPGAGGVPEPFWRMPVSYERARGAPGQPNPVGSDTPNVIDPEEPKRAGCFGPVSRYWPARKGLIQAVDKRAFEGAVWSLPDPMPWDYFQSALPDQQIEPLRGGELLLLEGLHPTARELTARLPDERAAARAILARPGEAIVEHEIPLVCDTLSIDGDAGKFALVWRGHFEVVGGEPELRFLGIAAELLVPGQASTVKAPIAMPTPQPGATSQPHAAEPAGSGTVRHGAADRARAALLPAVPFEYRPPRAGPSSGDATPWGGAPLQEVAPAVVGESTIAVSESPAARAVVVGAAIAVVDSGEPGGSTLGLSPAQQAEAAQKNAVPFPAGSSAPRARDASPIGLPFGGLPLPPVPPMQMVEDETHSVRPADVGPRSPVASAAGDQLAERLQGLGVAADELAELMAALEPPAPPAKPQ